MYLTDTTVGGTPAPKTTETRTVVMSFNKAAKVQLIHEALSRARMRRPQADYTPSTEAHRPARQIAIQARHRAARELGLY
jgi:hypothetical protein